MGRHDDDGERLLDQRRSVDRRARRTEPPVVDRGVDEAVAEVRGSPVGCADGELGRSPARCSGFGVVPRAMRRTPRSDGLLVAEGEAPFALVLVVEPFGEIEQSRLVERVAFGHGHAHVEVLARVAHLREEAEVDLRRA